MRRFGLGVLWERWDREETQRWVLVALLLLAAALFFSWVRRPGDFAGYLLVGELVLEGRHIYADAPPGINTWPPFFSLLCVPWTLLAAPSPYLSRGLFLLLNFGLLLLLLHWLAKLVYGRRLSLRAGGDRLSVAAPALLVPLLLSSRYVLSNFEHVQVNILIFALALGGLFLQARGRQGWGGVALGAAAALKVMPVLFLPYLAYRRRWRAAGSAALATVVFSVALPVGAFGWGRFWDYAAAWRDAVAVGWGVGKMNQSVYAMFDRWIGHGMVPLAVEGTNVVPEPVDPWVTVAVATLALAVAAVALGLFRGPLRPDGWPALAEWSVVFLAAALFSPVMWKAYLIVVLLPNTLLFAAWRSLDFDRRTRRLAGSVALAGFVLGVLTTRSVVGTPLSWRLEMASTVTLAGLILLAGLLWFRARAGRELAAARLAGENPCPAGSHPRG